MNSLVMVSLWKANENHSVSCQVTKWKLTGQGPTGKLWDKCLGDKGVVGGDVGGRIRGKEKKSSHWLCFRRNMRCLSPYVVGDLGLP